MTPTTPTAAPGVSVEAKISALMTLVDLHGAQRWNTGCYEQSGEKRLAKLADKQAVEARSKLETILRTAILASAAGGGEPVAWRRRVPVLDNYTHEYVSHWSTKTGEGWESLYTAPPPPVGGLQGVSEQRILENVVNLTTYAFMMGEDKALGKVTAHKESYNSEMAELRENIAAHPFQAQDAAPVEPIGHAVAVFMPGTCGFTMACFKASDVPPGTSIYASAPPAGVQGDAARLDFLDAMGGQWIARDSVTGRGYRLHQDRDGPHASAREAIDAAIAAQSTKGA